MTTAPRTKRRSDWKQKSPDQMTRGFGVKFYTSFLKVRLIRIPVTRSCFRIACSQ